MATIHVTATKTTLATKRAVALVSVRACIVHPFFTPSVNEIVLASSLRRLRTGLRFAGSMSLPEGFLTFQGICQIRRSAGHRCRNVTRPTLWGVEGDR